MRNTIVFLFLIGCTSADQPATDVSGHAIYRDSTTNSDNTPHQAAQPAAQQAKVTLEVRGTGTMSGLDASCLDGASGQFQALYHGDASLGSSGSVDAALDAAGTITTPTGCAIPTLTVGAVTGVTLRAELDTTTENCDTYCAASARADAESQCAGQADEASCRASAEASAQASCKTTCTTQSHAIVAETDLGIAALGQLTADQLKAGAFGSLTADLTFAHLE
ncbi:MAG TPA: hypothetical protein VL463_03265 [Kofleriaceae bacterium]|nr:hypothetical protein [Kofleriaceae bacterium]